MLSFALLLYALLRANDADAPIAKAARRGRKGLVTILAYVLAIAVAFLWPLVAVAIYIAVAAMWLIPDKRFEALIDYRSAVISASWARQSLVILLSAFFAGGGAFLQVDSLSWSFLAILCGFRSAMRSAPGIDPSRPYLIYPTGAQI